MEIFFLVTVIAIVIVIWFKYAEEKRRRMLEERRKMLLEKYGNEEVVNKIMQNIFWQGQASEQLMDSLGEPIDKDIRIMKGKTKEIWKYRETGKGWYALRITLEDDFVVGWDEKSSQ